MQLPRLGYNLVMLNVSTPRLRLIAADGRTARAELENPAALSTILNCEIPPDWPPPLNDEESARWFLNFITTHPDAHGWATWYFVLERGDRPIAIGSGGFKGLPDHGTVEIGYSVMPAWHRQGLASEGVDALLDWAFGHDDVDRVIAHTFPDLIPSLGVMRKCGFRDDGPGDEPGTVRTAITRDEYRRRRSSGLGSHLEN